MTKGFAVLKSTSRINRFSCCTSVVCFITDENNAREVLENLQKQTPNQNPCWMIDYSIVKAEKDNDKVTLLIGE